MIIGLTGRIAAGKTEIVNTLKSKGFKYKTMSDTIKQEAKARGIENTRKNISKLANEIREREGPGAWISRMIKEMNLNEKYIIDGIRNPGEITELRRVKDLVIISVDAPQRERFERLVSREKEGDPKTWEEFCERDNLEFEGQGSNGQRVKSCMELADFQLINDSTRENFRKRIEEVLEKIKCC